MPSFNRRWPALAVAALLALVCCCTASADPVNEFQAETVVAGWRAMETAPLGAPIGDVALNVDTYYDDLGAPLYYVVYLSPDGYVIVPADDWVEPIIAFVPSGRYDPSPSTPLGALVTNDLKSRIAHARAAQNAAGPMGAESATGEAAAARGKWALFSGEMVVQSGIETGLESISDPRVDPFVTSTWNQLTACSGNLYNYYTPNNYPSGCVATAMSQLMRYHQHPSVGPGTDSYVISVCGSAQDRSLLGGDGSGGAYDWANMPLNPTCPMTTAEREAIGALLHDAGVSVKMNYCSGGSAADTLASATAFTTRFSYTNARRGYNAGNNISTTTLNAMINPNLHAGYPVLLGITTGGSLPVGHAIVCDGYGYNTGTSYHHLNLGWSGSYTAWYNLPTIDAGSSAFVSVYKCVYNVFTSGMGEIIAGRVLDAGGMPIEGATVTSTPGGLSDTTDSRGLYAIPKLSSGATYTVVASKNGFIDGSQAVTTGTSTNDTTSCGNKTVDFALSTVSAACADEGFETGTITSLPWTTGPYPWSVVTTDKHSGTYSAKSYTVTPNSQTSYLEVTLNRGSAGTVSFYRRVSSELGYDKLRFLIDGNEQQVWSGEVAWNSSPLSYPVTSGSHVYRWEYKKDSSGTSGSDSAWIDDIVFPADDGFENGLSTWPWQTGGDASWATTTEEQLRGSYSAKAGTIANGESTHLQVTLNRSAGKVSFFPKVSSQAGDRLRFLIDDVEKGSWQGEVDWGCPAVSYSVTAGFHTYKWVYVKDPDGSGGSDTAWIDEVIFPAPCPGPAAPTSPGANANYITAESIRWTWTDASSDETGFKVYADPGSGPPTTLRATLPADTTYWDYTPILPNSQHCFQVAATNSCGDSARPTSITRYTLPVPPVHATSGPGAVSCDKGYGDPDTWYPMNSTFTFTAVNGFGAGPTRAYKYLYVWDNSPNEPASGWLNWTAGTRVQSAFTTGEYWLHLRSVNYENAANTATTHYGPYMVDVSPPAAPAVTDGGFFQSSATELSASWTAQPDTPSGLAEYKYAIGTNPEDIGSDYLVEWKSAGMNTQATESSLQLVRGTVYYWYVRVRDAAGNWSDVGASDGIVSVENAGASINEAKALPDGASVGLSSKSVTAVIGNTVYIEETDRRAGIRVEADAVPPGMIAGTPVDVAGAMITNIDGERAVAGIIQVQPGYSEIAPVGMHCGSLGGGAWAYDSGTGAGQQGVEGATGLNNIGLLVRTWGKVTSIEYGTFASWDLDTNPGWTAQSPWAYGTPLGGGGGHGFPDPTSGYTGTKVYGVNLAGNYSTAAGGPYYLTAGPIDCSASTGTTLRFWRWLNCDTPTYVQATVDVSRNGTTWTSVWINTGAMTASSWSQCTYPEISAVADGQSTVYIRWGHRVLSSYAYAYSGWNIDDIELIGTGNTCVVEDGSGSQVQLVYPEGYSPPPVDTFVTVSGISSCYRDGEGKIRRALLVTE